MSDLMEKLTGIIRPKCKDCLGSGTLKPTLHGFNRHCPCPWCNGKGIIPPDITAVDEILTAVADAVEQSICTKIYYKREVAKWLRTQAEEKVEEQQVGQDTKNSPPLFQLFIGGSKTSFHCKCGCNVFKKTDQYTYWCNACGETYVRGTEVRAQAEGKEEKNELET